MTNRAGGNEGIASFVVAVTSTMTTFSGTADECAARARFGMGVATSTLSTREWVCTMFTGHDPPRRATGCRTPA